MIVIEGRAYYRGELRHLCIGIEDGVIKEIRKTLRGEDVYDYGERILLPGGVDVHVHFREPGLTHKEDFYTGTESAAVGGITTVLDMPNTVPPATTAAALLEKREMASRRANVDFGLYGGVERSEDMEGLKDHCHAFKVYMAESFGRLSPPPEEVRRILQALKRAGRRLAVHAEDPSHFNSLEETSLRDHWLARPDEAEEAAIRNLAAWHRDGVIHLAHLSSRLGLGAVAGSRFSLEVTPMHLLLDWHAPIGALGKVNPPLRNPEDREALWRAFSSGRIDVLASDHAPHTLGEKEDFLTAPPGAPNVETLYPMMFALVRRGRLSLEVLVRALCRRPAELFGLRGKGTIEVGADADIVVFDPRKMSKVRADDLHYRCGWTPFEGW
ncbi:MAG: dihydroorotase family protein, partial [Thermoplasmata archaeon]